MAMNKASEKGFTLAELLIVIAIIGVLTAVSIPIFLGQLDKAKAAADMANVRSAKGAAVTEYLSSSQTSAAVYYYDANNGTITMDSAKASSIKGYGKSTKDLNDDQADGVPYENGQANIVKAVIAKDGSASLYWIAPSSTAEGSKDLPFSGIGVSDWSSLVGNNLYGTSIEAGTVVSDGTSNYLFYANNDWYDQAVKGSSLSSLYTSQNFAGRVEKIDSSTSVMAVSDFIPRKSISAGTIASYKGKYYVLKQTMDYSQYDSDPEQDENWAAIGQ
jgi:type IV pilus assembly protein PilA